MNAASNTPIALKNHLLASLPENEYIHLKSKLEPINFKLGDVLYESGDRLEYAYFPTTAIISLLFIMENGSTAEIGVVGNDGVLGMALFMGGETTTSRAIIQSAGVAFRMRARDLMDEFTLGGVFQKMLLRYSGIDDPDFTDRRLQSAPFGRAAAVPLDTAQPRPPGN